MSELKTYSLWFVNDSVNPGKVCVYLDPSGVECNFGTPEILAWMITDANPGVAVRFDWKMDYNFLWIQRSPTTQAQQIVPTELGANNSIPLTYNDFGFTFQTPTTVSDNEFWVKEDGTIPVPSSAVVGIGLHGAGTYVHPVRPNLNLQFKPVPPPPYRITFGNYPFSVNDPIDLDAINTPGIVEFQPNYNVMTATLGKDNTWAISTGPPPTERPFDEKFIVYEAGKGIVAPAGGIDSVAFQVALPE